MSQQFKAMPREIQHQSMNKDSSNSEKKLQDRNEQYRDDLPARSLPPDLVSLGFSEEVINQLKEALAIGVSFISHNI